MSDRTSGPARSWEDVYRTQTALIAELETEITALRERVREAAEELSNPSVTFADPRVSYEEIQLTAGWRKEWLSYPEVVRALEEER